MGPSFSRANDREYGAWGDIRSGSGGDQGYVANLGHRRDAESGLTYMRARYYEPETGRFVSEDPSFDGLNWYAYCSNDPTLRHDSNGRDDEADYVSAFSGALTALFGLIAFGAAEAMAAAKTPAEISFAVNYASFCITTLAAIWSTWSNDSNYMKFADAAAGFVVGTHIQNMAVGPQRLEERLLLAALSSAILLTRYFSGDYSSRMRLSHWYESKQRDHLCSFGTYVDSDYKSGRWLQASP